MVVSDDQQPRGVVRLPDGQRRFPRYFQQRSQD
jgi:hypothetical protein